MTKTAFVPLIGDAAPEKTAVVRPDCCCVIRWSRLQGRPPDLKAPAPADVRRRARRALPDQRAHICCLSGLLPGAHDRLLAGSGARSEAFRTARAVEDH